MGWVVAGAGAGACVVDELVAVAVAKGARAVGDTTGLRGGVGVTGPGAPQAAASVARAQAIARRTRRGGAHMLIIIPTPHP